MRIIIQTKREQGSVLLWGLVILLVLTVIGVAASRTASTDSRIAGNQMMYMLTFQGADSMLRRSFSLYQVLQTASNGTAPSTYDKLAVKVLTLSNYADTTSKVSARGQMAMSEPTSCPPLKGIAMSTEMNSDSGGVSCRVFTSEAEASLAGTGARSDHSEGILKPVPTVH